MAERISDYPAKSTFSNTDFYDCSSSDGAGGYVSQKVTGLQLRNNIFGVRFDETIDQTTISQLNTLNAGYGYELLEAPGANKTIHLLTDILLVWNIVGDSFIDGELDVKFHDEVKLATVPIWSGTVLPIKFIQNMGLLSNESFFGTTMGIFGINQKLMLWTTVEQSSIIEGTLRIIFDYEILDV